MRHVGEATGDVRTCEMSSATARILIELLYDGNGGINSLNVDMQVLRQVAA